MKEIRPVLIYQETLPDYRISFLNSLGKQLPVHLAFGDATPLKEVKPELGRVSHFQYHLLKRKTLGKGFLTRHQGLFPLLKRLDPGVIIAEPRLGLLNVWRLAFSPYRKRLVWWLSGHEPEEAGWKRSLRRTIRKRLYQRASAFIVYGSTGGQYLRVMGMKQAFFLAWNATGSEEIAAAKGKWEEGEGEKQKQDFRAPGTYSLLYIGRLIAEKKVLLLPDILAALDQHSGKKDTGMVVIGEGPAMEALRDKARRMGLGERIRFEGALQGPEQNAGFFLSADLLLLPGKGGLAISEAIQYGLPVVAGKADGTEQDLVVSGENGFLVDEENPEAFAAAIMKVIASEEILHKMRAASREQAATYGNTNAMQQGFLQAIDYITQSQDEV